MNNRGKIQFAISALSLFALVGNSQISTNQLNGGINTITTAVPFLLIAPDSRAGGMGECGVATSADANSFHWNTSKLAFADKKVGIAVSYSPWLRQLVPDINLAYLSGYTKLDKRSSVGGSLRYFSLGNITFTDIVGNTIGNYRPNEFALDLGYARQLGDKFSGGMAMRYIYSNLTSGIPLSNGASTHAGKAFAVDLSMMYHDTKMKISDKKTEFNIGLNLSNIGTKISYTDNGSADAKDFIPINMKLGSYLRIDLDDANSFAVAVDINKLMVPTPPTYDVNGNIIAGKDPNRSIASGMFGSFNDAPGGGKEELKEIIYQIGLEYWYNKQFAVRAGYFNEDRTKGNRKFFTLGAGVKYNVFGLDFAYLIPIVQRNPLQNTLRFTLSFDFDAFKKQNESDK